MHIAFPQCRLIAASLLLAAATQAHASGYEFIDLSTPLGASSSAAGINNLNQIVGLISVTGGTPQSAALWSNNSLSLLSALHAGDAGNAMAINDLGQIVGSSYGTSSNAVVWNSGTPTALPMADQGGAPPASSSYAYGINGTGQVVGASTWPYMSSVPAQWSADGSTVTALANKCCGGARAINDNGVIVGHVPVMGTNHAMVWNGGIATDLGAQLPGSSVALDINNAGQIVGSSGLGNPTATTWINGQATLLASLGGNYSEARAINSAGLIVGTASINPNSTPLNPDDLRAVLWNGTTVIDLNSFLDPSMASAGWVLRSASDINDNGWIVGTAVNNQLNLTHAFVLATAVPESSTACMMLIGLVGLRVLARRRDVRKPN